MDLSIVIINWNTRDLLHACLTSVFEHLEGIEAEVFVVDNASEDDSVDMVARQFPQAVLISNDENVGFGPANNQALRRATGRHHLLLNSDTVVLGDVLRTSVEYMDRHPDVGVFGCRVLNPDRTMQATCFMYPSLFNIAIKTTGLFKLRRPRFLGREHYSHWARDTERDVQVVTGCYLMARAEAMDRVGLLDERFFFCGEETDWCRRFRENGWKIRFSPVGEIIHIGNASGARLRAGRDLLLTDGIVRYQRKHAGPIGGALAWVMLFLFSASRAVVWSCIGLATRRQSATERGTHFREVIRGFGRVGKGRA